MIPAALRYHRATSLNDALAALADPEARAVAGGQSLLPVLKLRIARPSVLVDIGRLELGAAIEIDGDALRLSPLSTWDSLARAKELARPALAAIDECAVGIGDLQVRNRGTVGGSIAHADPSSDMPAVLLALGARLELRSHEGTRTVDLADFFSGPFTTNLEPGELITSIVVDLPARGSGSAYESVEHPASGFALAGAAALARSDGTHVVALTGIGARPSVLPDGAVEATEVFGDDFASEDYRRHLAGVVARRALERARARAEEDARWTT